jgi:AcrR family transcriptional regulator
MRTESRKKILEAALELFAYEGYHSTSMHKVAKHAGVSKGLLYNYFEGKEDLLKRIFDFLLEMSESYMQPDPELSAEERFRLLTEGSFEMIQSDSKY